ncbi:helix-turn-helix transcriptional regulator [Bacillus massiliigorillae]|uniref:helix-turn-helix transcriptional regulator n=1 Tax=Bacillus massiliigorillae TaxID=1243664 RepID=UPI00039BE1AD|nr:helix-turn-helix transcriptional regulator [Bacillus massiliigorillae]
MNHDFYTAEEVAILLKLSKYTIYEMVKRGELPAVKVGRKVRINKTDIDRLLEGDSPKKQESTSLLSNEQPIRFIGSHDLLVELALNTYNSNSQAPHCIPAYVGSMEGLLCLYYDRADFVGCHIFDEETTTYNIEIVKRLFPGEDMVLFHFAKRNIGWIVPKGNPKQLSNWQDLKRPQLTFVNRQKGSGTRLLLDCFRKRLNLSKTCIKGYSSEELTHYGAASVVARGDADFALGSESAALALGLDFIQLQQEQYDFIMKRSFYDSLQWQEIQSIIQSTNIKKLDGYDTTQLGTIQEV